MGIRKLNCIYQDGYHRGAQLVFYKAMEFNPSLQLKVSQSVSYSMT